MATHKTNFYLYTGFDATAAAGIQAVEHLNDCGITYTHMHYWSGMDEVLTWVTENFTNSSYAIENAEFPFVVYETIVDEERLQQVLVYGIKDILSTPWANLAAFGG
jgi:hypothetical protein